MDKAILVIDMPKNCGECILNKNDKCCVKGFNTCMFVNCKPKVCPLQQMPEKSHTGKSDYYQWGDWEDGWNACIDGLLPD